MNGDGTGIAQFGTFEAVVADNDIIQVAMLEYDAGPADGNTFAAIGAFFGEDDISAVLAPVNGALGANLHTLAALGTDLGLVYTRFREPGFDSQTGLFGINFPEMADGANL